MNDPSHDLDRLIDQLLEGTMKRRAFAELEARLLGDPELRRRFRARMRLDSNLRTLCQEISEDMRAPFMYESTAPRRRWVGLAAFGGIAAALVIATVTHWRSADSEAHGYVATIQSQEGAAWSGEHMVGNGSGLNPGILKLEKGLATLRFESGVLVDLEAPVTIELVDTMRCRMTRGKAVFDVPESGIGFVVETPNGYAVDHGTRFAVGLQPDGKDVEFGVLDGFISVHHEQTQTSEEVRTGGMVLMTESGIGEAGYTGHFTPAGLMNPGTLRIPTNGRETSVVHGDIRGEFLEPGLLMVKKDPPFPNEAQLRRLLWSKDRRSLLAFNLDELGSRQAARAVLRLNMVPSGRGYAKLLPELTEIQVYGVHDSPEQEHWETEELKWADTPGSVGESTQIDGTEVTLLGSFGIGRSQFEGPVVFESEELTRFINEDSTGVVAFLLVSNSMPEDRWSLVHAFASSQHTEAAGPMLEITLK